MFKGYYLKKLKKYKCLVLHTICKIFGYQYIDTSDSGTSPIPVPAPALPLYKCIFVKFRLIKMKHASGETKLCEISQKICLVSISGETLEFTNV
jgi:hypothetical protein